MGQSSGIIDPLAPPAGRPRGQRPLRFYADTLADNKSATSGILRLGATGRFTTVLADRNYHAHYINSETETCILIDESLPQCQVIAWAYCVEPRCTHDVEMVDVDRK